MLASNLQQFSRLNLSRTGFAGVSYHVCGSQHLEKLKQEGEEFKASLGYSTLLLCRCWMVETTQSLGKVYGSSPQNLEQRLMGICIIHPQHILQSKGGS